MEDRDQLIRKILKHINVYVKTFVKCEKVWIQPVN